MRNLTSEAINVRAEVLVETGGMQRPVEATQLTGDVFYLNKSDYTDEKERIEEVIYKNDTTKKPIWLMRQAGRYLPEFREIRKKNPDFINLCLNDKLASKITLQPIKRFDLDAAIIFSDILFFLVA